MKLQTLMHNQMAGFDVSKEMMALEQTLPPGFREKMARLMYLANGITVPGATTTIEKPAEPATATPKDFNEARLVILRSVAGGMMSPEEAVKILFPEI